MSRHTPGPWWVDDGRLTHPESGIKSGGTGLRVMASHRGPGSSYTVAVVNSYPRPEGEDDARLLAAAPEMLEALRGAMHALRSYQYGNGATELAESLADHAEALIARVEKPT